MNHPRRDEMVRRAMTLLLVLELDFSTPTNSLLVKGPLHGSHALRCIFNGVGNTILLHCLFLFFWARLVSRFRVWLLGAAFSFLCIVDRFASCFVAFTRLGLHQHGWTIFLHSHFVTAWIGVGVCLSCICTRSSSPHSFLRIVFTCLNRIVYTGRLPTG